ncbi:Lysine exporter protein (LYSE/YGGA) [Ferroglobus placidus DSM 10642]|uniref:Lysine exporter protein (LYSE/YGGA) n=1 Tax=Ferroglobus placidus (strain DSM 10642 / AEDII12DO) TaxID=589924 RepID=D3S3G7_FERPA|nr:LysE family transporter [Ferroglobus placidus]ADC64800.1 Lysine exporter protein (LYSE/YGGA) [Ferroglobus placidus DSM 10642]
MDFPLYLAMVFTISLSGVLSPGPLFAATLSEGLKNPFSGFKISAGHAIVEIPLIISLYFAGFHVTENLKAVIALVGGLFLLYLSYEEFKSKTDSERKVRGTMTGIILTALNPYFIMWWLTVGFSLISLSYEFGSIGLVLFVLVHESADFGWLGFVSFASHRLSKYAGLKRKLEIFSASIFAIFGVYFVTNSVLYFIS